MKSKRSDGRGHWPAGKRRHPLGNWNATRRRLNQFVQKYQRRGHVSYRALACHLGVSQRSVIKWKNGTNRPNTETQEAISQWISSMQP